MQEIKTDHITWNGKEYPVYCDLRVLEKIQNEFETITQFERALLGQEIVYDEDGNAERDEAGNLIKKDTEPSIRAAVRGLYLMMEEGRRIEESQGKEVDPVSEDDIMSYAGNFYALGLLVHGIFMKCFASKKKEEKQTTSKKTRT